MKDCPWIKETKREFIQSKIKEANVVRKALNDLQLGCAVTNKLNFSEDVHEMQNINNNLLMKLRKWR